MNFRQRCTKRLWMVTIFVLVAMALACTPETESKQTAPPPPLTSQGSPFNHFNRIIRTHVKESGAPVYHCRVIERYPHDPDAFTQGLFFHDGLMYEGTGRIGQSGIRRYSLGKVTPRDLRKLAHQYFGEGITALGSELFQITWRKQTGYRYDLESLTIKGTFHYEGEGWGITSDGKSLIMSNGSSQIQFMNPTTYAVERRIEVQAGEAQVTSLNELEYIDGLIYANIWRSDWIVCVDPKDGSIQRWINAENLRPQVTNSGAEVLNGIAWDGEARRLFLTGKCWDTIFEVETLLDEGIGTDELKR